MLTSAKFYVSVSTKILASLKNIANFTEQLIGLERLMYLHLIHALILSLVLFYLFVYLSLYK